MESTPPALSSVDQAFASFTRTGDPSELAKVFDATAPALLRLASHLVSDLDLAEDLVQATFLVAIQNCRDYTPSRPVLQWLTGILTNRAHQLRRKLGRRVDPLRLSSRSVQEPPEKASAIEFTRAVSDAIAGIPLPYRPVLLMHLKHGQSVQEIALVLERAPGTVRKQLSRGMEMLREALPPGLAVGMAVFALPSRGLASIREAVLAQAATIAVPAATGLLGVSLIMKKTLIALSVCMAIGLTYVAWPSSTLAEIESPLSSANLSRVDLPEHADTAADDTRETAAKRTEVLAEAAAWIVRGRVRRGIKEPFSGARLKVELFGGYDRSGEPVISAEIRSGPDGRFAWALEPPSGTVSLRFSSGDTEVWVIPLTRLVVAQQAPPENIILNAFPFDARIEGRVTNASGEPLQASLLQSRLMSEDRIHCDEDGRFSMRVSSSSSRILLHAAAPGYAMTRKTVVSPEPGETIVVDIELSAALTVRGRVTDKEGNPIEGAEVATFFTSRYGSVLTDEKGRYTIDYLEPGRRSHSLYARKEGYVEAKTWVRIAELLESYDLVLDPGLRCEGRVTGPDGRPVPGARLYIGFSRSSYNRLDAVAKDDGSFVFPNIASEENDLVTEAAGFAPDLRRLEIPKNSQLPINIEVRLELGKTLSGIVVDELGTPLEGISMSARTPSSGPLEQGRSNGGRFTTDVEGRFMIVDLPSGKVDIQFFHRGFIRYTEEGVVTGREDLRIEMKRSAKLAGKVVDGRTGKALDQFRIRFVTIGTGGMAATWARAGREFRRSGGLWDTGTTNLLPGEEFVIEASADGYGLATFEVEAEIEPDPEQHVLQLFTSERIAGRVIALSTGEPITDARVVLSTDKNPVDPRNSEDFYGRVVATTDADGRFEMDDVPLGEVSLAVQHPDWPLIIDGPFSVSPGMLVDRSILVQSLGRLAGTVVDADGQALAGVMVRVLAQKVEVYPRGELRATTDSQGKFELDRGLEPGIYIVFVENSESQSPFTVISSMVEIALGETSDVSLQPTGSGEIIGTIESDEAELPDSFHLMIRLLPRDVPESLGIDIKVYYSKSEGNQVHVKGLPPGRYMVFASEGQIMGSAEVSVAESEPGRVTLKVRSMTRFR